MEVGLVGLTAFANSMITKGQIVNASQEDIYDFETLINTDWPTSDYEHFVPGTEAQCKRSCINDYFCAVAILGEGSCWKKKLPLSNGREDNVVNRQAFLKFRKSDPRTLLSPLVLETKKNQRTLILVGSLLLEDPSLRPTMRKVTQMPEGVVEVDVPPCPSQVSFTS
ncbi:G-type lectin S-receptor-like serine/threonine-protein kinase LECRK4 [Camellia lanceoleosa]|uniref:G-type lectin S-receptor-like serine/threonine-protein kinase LECRK4 n=1 Tax=Camellia lanceoleosa TaxID=1840588 RepID=A0ACC0F7Q9_9ERIC|nr:G-type lectin S-receptor-like serine/threonine-protein kinase LECRK4 [Camellia lanceoleosa]